MLDQALIKMNQLTQLVFDQQLLNPQIYNGDVFERITIVNYAGEDYAEITYTYNGGSGRGSRTISITAKQFRKLRAVADAMDTVPITDHPDTTRKHWLAFDLREPDTLVAEVYHTLIRI